MTDDEFRDGLRSGLPEVQKAWDAYKAMTEGALNAESARGQFMASHSAVYDYVTRNYTIKIKLYPWYRRLWARLHRRVAPVRVVGEPGPERFTPRIGAWRYPDLGTTEIRPGRK